MRWQLTGVARDFYMHPVLFQVPTPWGGTYIYSYGVMLGLSLIIGWQFVMYYGARKQGLDKEVLSNCYLVTALSAIVGSRVLYIVTNLDSFESPAKWFDLRSGGLVAYGGFLGGAIGAAVFLRIKRVSFLAFADAAAPALAAGLSCTRIGCYLYGCDFGKRLSETAPGWLKSLGTFPRWDQFGERLHGSPAWLHHVQLYDLSRSVSHSYPVHPTQLYEVAIGLVLLAVAIVVWMRRRFRGQVLLTLTIGYAAWRFVLEYLRDDPERGEAFGFSTSQLISLALLPIAVITWAAVKKASADGGGKTEGPALAEQSVEEKTSDVTRKPKKNKKRK
jgi:phosphatidylglycerol:prolipoprotein diacylglycerol transferase